MLPTPVDFRWWDEIPLADRASHRFAIGPNRIWVRRSGPDLAWASLGSQPEQEDAAETAGQTPANGETDLDSLSWQRWATDRKQMTVRILPVFPVRSLVVRSQQPLTIAARLSVRFYVGIPCVIRLELCGDKPVIVGEVPSVELSTTWFGDPTEGELCLALKSRARRSLDELEVAPYRVLCPLDIHNATDEPFAFERACVRIPHCAIYYGAGRLWSSAVRIAYRGVNASNMIDIENRPPPEAAPDAVQVSPPRVPGGLHGGLFSLVGLRGAWMSL